MKVNEKETLLKELINLRDQSSNDIISLNNIDKFSKKDFDVLYALKEDNLINYKWYSDGPHCLSITPDGDLYFDLKHQKEKEKSKELFRSWVPIIISLIALLKSFSPQIHELIQWLTR